MVGLGVVLVDAQHTARAAQRLQVGQRLGDEGAARAAALLVDVQHEEADERGVVIGVAADEIHNGDEGRAVEKADVVFLLRGGVWRRDLHILPYVLGGGDAATAAILIILGVAAAEGADRVHVLRHQSPDGVFAGEMGDVDALHGEASLCQ